MTPYGCAFKLSFITIQWILSIVSSSLTILPDISKNPVEAGISQSISFGLELTDQERLSQQDTFDVLVSLRAFDNPNACSPTAITSCFNSTVITISDIQLLSGGSTTPVVVINVPLPYPIDYSLVGSQIEAQASIKDVASSSYTIVTDVVTGDAPTAVGNNSKIIAGIGGNSKITITGTGFSRFASQMTASISGVISESIEITMPENNSNLFHLVLALKTKCDDELILFDMIDTSLVGSALVLTSLSVTGSTLALVKNVIITSSILPPANKELIVTKFVSFDDDVATITGVLSCKRRALRFIVTSNTKVGLMPDDDITILSLSPSAISLQFTSCNNQIGGLDYSMSGSVLRLQIVVESIDEQITEKLNISPPALIAPVPVVVFTSVSVVAGDFKSTLFTLPGVGFSCVPEWNRVSLSLPKEGVLLPKATVVSASRNSLEVELLTDCGEASVSGIDVSMVGSALEGSVAVLSTSNFASPSIPFTSTITNAVDTELALLEYDDDGSIATVKASGLSCVPEYNKLEVVLEKEHEDVEVPKATVVSYNGSEALIKFTSCNNEGVSGIDASMGGYPLDIKVLSSGRDDSIRLLEIIPKVPVTLNNSTIVAGGQESVEISGTGFSCRNDLNKVVVVNVTSDNKDSDLLTPPFFTIERSTPTLLSTRVWTNVSSPSLQGNVIPGLDASLINSELSIRVKSTAKQFRVLGDAPRGVVTALEQEFSLFKYCNEEEDAAKQNETVAEVQVEGVPVNPEFSNATLFLRSVGSDNEGIYVIEDLQVIVRNSSSSKVTLFLKFIIPSDAIEQAATFGFEPNNLELLVHVIPTNLTSDRITVGGIGDCTAALDKQATAEERTSSQISSNSPGLGNGTWAGILIAVVAITGLVAELLYVRCKRKRQENSIHRRSTNTGFNALETPQLHTR